MLEGGHARVRRGEGAACGTPIRVTTLFPGYLRSEMDERVAHRIRFLVDIETGCRAVVGAIEREVDEAYVPRLPWAVGARVLRNAPLRVV